MKPPLHTVLADIGNHMVFDGMFSALVFGSARTQIERQRDAIRCRFGFFLCERAAELAPDPPTIVRSES